VLDGPRDALQRMLGKQLQDADELPAAGAGAVPAFQILTQVGKDRRQLPMPKEIGMIQRRWPPSQRRQIVQRVEDLFAAAVRTRMPRDDLAAGHYTDVIHVALDGHRLESEGARHAVAIAVETYRLIFVYLAGLLAARIKGLLGQSQGLLVVAAEALADRLLPARLGPFAIAQTTVAQVGIKLSQVLHLRYRCRPVPLQELHPAFDTRLLLRLTHHAEQRLEAIVAGQGRVTLVEHTLSALEQNRRHRFGIVPPHLTRHTTKKSECFDQTVQNGLGSLRWQGDGERTIGVRPGHQQNRNLLATLGEINVDMPEVGLDALARIVVERDERLPCAVSLPPHIQAHPIVTARVAVLLLQTPKQLRRRVPLLARRLLIGRQDRVKDLLERLKNRRGRVESNIPFRLGVGENLADLPPRMVKLSGQRFDAQPIHRMGSANTSKFVHRDHPSPPCSWT
jgi:hypothetical protein